MGQKRDRTPPPRGRAAPPSRDKRALSGLRGGGVDRSGEPALAALCAHALDVVASDEPLDFTHGFHSYPARFHPLLARRLFAALPTARRVLDPFVGSGTTLVEAALAGRTAFGSDVNPLSIMLARLKSTAVGAELSRHLRATAAAIAERCIAEGKAARRSGAAVRPPASGTRFDDPRAYLPHVYRELVALRLGIDEAAPEAAADRWLRDGLLLTLSAIVVKVSRQRSDTDPTMVDRAIGRGAAARHFAARADLLARELAGLAAAVPPGTPAPDVRRSDARKLRHLAQGSIDLVVTSPPYLGTYDYTAHHQRRFGWLGIDGKSLAIFRKFELGPRRDGSDERAAAARWRLDVAAFTAEIARVLAPGGLAFVLVGDSTVGQLAVVGDAELRRAALAPGVGLAVAASASQARSPHGEGGAAGRPPRREHLVALRRV